MQMFVFTKLERSFLQCRLYDDDDDEEEEEEEEEEDDGYDDSSFKMHLSTGTDRN